jgi:hypothetical protein
MADQRHFWAFVCDPARWAIDDFLRSDKVEDVWGVDRLAKHQNSDFHEGQLAIVRVLQDKRSLEQLHGNQRLRPGIYALCEILSPVFPRSGNPDEYSYGTPVHPEGWPTVRVRYIRSYLNDPLLIEDLRRDAPALDARVLQGPRRSSIKLKQDDFWTIKTLLDEREADERDALDTHDPALSETERAALSKARIGQGQFRSALLERWKRACAVTGCEVGAILRASHMKPWCVSTNSERLDPSNGLLLTAHLDALFDKELISFTDDGNMLISNQIDITNRQLLGIPRCLRFPLGEKERLFLHSHRERFEVRNP